MVNKIVLLKPQKVFQRNGKNFLGWGRKFLPAVRSPVCPLVFRRARGRGGVRLVCFSKSFLLKYS
jgi:hypothetical protein